MQQQTVESTVPAQAARTTFTSVVGVCAIVVGVPLSLFGVFVAIALAFGAAFLGLFLGLANSSGASPQAPDALTLAPFVMVIVLGLGQLAAGLAALVAGIGLLQRNAWGRALMLGVLGLEIVLALVWLGLGALGAVATAQALPDGVAAVDLAHIAPGRWIWVALFIAGCAALIHGFFAPRVRAEFGLR